MSGFRSELAAARKIIDDEEMIGNITAGLDNTYNALVDRVKNTPSISLTDVTNQINSFDMSQTLLADLDNKTGPFISSANVGTCGGSSSRGPSPDRDHCGDWRHDDDRRHDDWRHDDMRDDRRRDEPCRDDMRDDRRRYDRRDDRHRDEPCRDDRHDDQHCDDRRRDVPHREESGRSRGRDRTPTPFIDVRCQICKIYGHPASDCWWHHGDDIDDEVDRNVKEVHAAAYGIDTNWNLDSGATDHITGALNKLTVHNKYNGRDHVHTTDGNSMHINHIFHSVLHTPSSPLHLKNILHVPSASKNLLSIHSLAPNNHVFLQLHPFFFLIKDLVTRRTLLKVPVMVASNL
jgi:hypothetical protein